MPNLTEHLLVPNHATEKWLSKNKPEVYYDILEYCKNIPNLNFKQQLWHYHNDIQHNVLCAKIGCFNTVNFKERWTLGYYKFCSQQCSTDEVEHKKSLLNYSRASKLTKEEKEKKIQEKEVNKEKRKEKILQNKALILDKINYYNTISIDEFKRLNKSENINGIYSRESYIRDNMNHIYVLINAIGTQYNDISFNEKVYMFINDYNERPKCNGCDNDKIYKDKSIGYAGYCSVSCASTATYSKGVDTLKLKYGVTHQSSLPQQIERRKQNKIKKVVNAINGCNYEYDEINDSFKITCDKCNKIHDTAYCVLTQRIYLELDWRDCISASYVSNQEIEVREYIESIYSGEVKYNNRDLLNNRHEIDIYIPEFKIGIEYNGIFYHNEFHKDMYYHHNKWKAAYEQDIKLIQIYSDEWTYKKDIVKSRIKNLLNLNNRKIYARKCVIKPVNFTDTKEFLLQNHLQGNVNSSINYGLYYNDELVSIMTFGKPRKALKYSSINAGNIYELYRYCTKCDINVIGGANRLFNHFINDNLNVNEIYSFSALEWPGKIYEKLGMTLKSTSHFSYWYIKNDLRVSRHNYNKQNLIKMGYDSTKSSTEILKELKIYRIYGAGNKTFVWKRN